MFGISEGRMALVGGANYSTIEGIEEQMSESVTLEYLPGFRLGIEITGKGLLAGLTYSQRGFQMSTEVDSVSSTGKVFFNYITGYALARIKLSSTLNLLLGPEIGYFMEGILTVESNGEEVES